MDKIILFLLIGLVGWWIGNMLGQVQYPWMLDTDVGPFEMIVGIVGSSASVYWSLYAFGTR